MKSFDYVRPASVEEAITAASLPGAAYLAAGTNLLDLMKGGVNRPDRLVDVMHLPGLDRVEPLGDGGLRIGALVRNADLAHDPAFAGTYPAVAEALSRPAVQRYLARPAVLAAFRHPAMTEALAHPTFGRMMAQDSLRASVSPLFQDARSR